MHALTSVPSTYVASLTGYEQTGEISAPSLAAVSALLAELGAPQRNLRSVHVTGTNGKGSTTAFLERLLMGHGLSVGLFTSPHLHSPRERIRVDGTSVTDAELDELLSAVAAAAARARTVPSWFEAMTAAAFQHFAHRRVDCAVVEVGMLGRWDATNVVRGEVAVVTNVGTDHAAFAGPERSDIAEEKAGIVKRGSTLVLGESDPALRLIFTRRGAARVLVLGEHLGWRATGAPDVVDITTGHGTARALTIGPPGVHQRDNAVLAVAAAEAFLGGPLATAVLREALAATQVPGRFEVLGSRPRIVLDVAHNREAAAALRATLDAAAGPVGRQVLLCGLPADRDPHDFLRALDVGCFDGIVTTASASRRALAPQVLREIVADLGGVAEAVNEPSSALARAEAMAGRAGTVVVTGSTYLVGAVREAVLGGHSLEGSGTAHRA